MESFRRPREAKPSLTKSAAKEAEEGEEDYVEEEEDVEEEEEEEDCDGFGFQDGVVKKKKKVIGVGGCKRRGSAAAAGDGGDSPPCCQADKCAADLIGAKRYHRRHKVCEAHAKAPMVVVAGLPQRFCQQCSRFHELSEFDEAKRSCRKRLAWHNERRRKCSSETHGEDSSRQRLSCRLESSIKGNST